MLPRSTLLLFAYFLHARAQTSKVVCDAAWSWTSNSLGQNPCVMAAYSRAVCSGNTDVGALSPGTFYIGPPDPSAADNCWCSSVTYSLLSACQLCQGEMDMRTWDQWTTNCSAQLTTNGGYPNPIPAGTAFPAWTYQTFRPEQAFSAVEAQNIANSNTTEATRTSSNSSAGPSSTFSSGLESSTPTNEVSTTSNPSKSNASAIAGGVVGGVIGLALIALAALFFLRRRRQNHTAPSALYRSDKQLELESTPFVPTHTRRDETGALKYYDPSDPSTFPTPPTPAPGMPYSATTDTPYSQNTRSSFSGPPAPLL